MSGAHPRRRDFFSNLLRKTPPNSASRPGRPLPSSTASSSHSFTPPPHPSPSTQPGQRLLDEAFKALSPAQQSTIRDHRASGTQDIRAAVEEAQNAAKKQQQLCEDRKWQWNFRGRQVVLRDEADKVLCWLDRFKSVGDVVANVAPLYAGIPWAGIRIILEVLKFLLRETKLYT